MNRLLSIPLLLLLTSWVFAADSPLATETVQGGMTSDRVVFDGLIEAVNQSTISAQTSGQITQILFDVNDYVEKDAVIMHFKDNEQRARLQQAQANLKEATARLKQAEQEYERIAKIYAKKLVSKAAFDKATADRKAAHARLDAATAALTTAQQQFDYTLVRAPYSGILTKRFVQVGEIAKVGQPLVTGISLETLRASVEVPQKYVTSIRQHGSASILINGHEIPSTKVVVFPYADEGSHSFRVRVYFAPGQAGLYPGMFVKTAFPVGEAQRLTIPVQALVVRSEVHGVYIVNDNNKVVFRQIRTGDTYGDRVEVLAGLSSGEKVALDPVNAALVLKQAVNN